MAHSEIPKQNPQRNFKEWYDMTFAFSTEGYYLDLRFNQEEELVFIPRFLPPYGSLKAAYNPLPTTNTL